MNIRRISTYVVLVLSLAIAMPVMTTGCSKQTEKVHKKKKKKKKKRMYRDEDIEQLDLSAITFGDNHRANKGNTYYPEHMMDGNPATAWSVDLDHYSYDLQSLEGPIFYFPEKVKIAYIVIRNGYHKNATIFNKNTRLRNVEFYNPAYNGHNEAGDGSLIYAGPVADTMSEQRIDFERRAPGNHNITRLAMRIPFPRQGGTVRGSSWDDLCVSEIKFYGWREDDVDNDDDDYDDDE